jgi:hypothetical protein
LLLASSAGRTPPDLFRLYLGQPEISLPDQLAHTKVPNPIPRTDNIAFAALIAIPEGFTTGLFYEIQYLF